MGLVVRVLAVLMGLVVVGLLAVLMASAWWWDTLDTLKQKWYNIWVSDENCED